MGTPRDHAKVSPSASGRWLNCTAAPTFEEQFPEEKKSIYAEKGTLAHRICELTVQYNNGQITKRKFNSQIKKCQEDPVFEEHMMTTARFDAEYIWEKAMSFDSKPFLVLEDRVDLSDWIPEGFGSCDCIMIGGEHLHITDYKNGVGEVVDSRDNPQMRLYALGALKKYGMLFPIKTVSMAIVQPNVTEDVTEDEMTVEALLEWGELIRPIAEKAATGIGTEFNEGPWCRFCKGKAVCRARSENMTALEDFKDLPIEGKLTEEEKSDRAAVIDAGFVLPPVLTNADIGDLLTRGERLVSWYKDLKQYAQDTILAGGDIPGWKVVEGKSNRAFDDADAAFEDILKAGYEEAMLYERKPKTLAALEKMIGKKQFAEICGKHVVKPQGAPTLVDVNDGREPYNSAASDFKGVEK